MCKSLMTLHVLELINTSLKEVRKRSEKINHADDFLISESGVILLDSICMKLSAVGESIKNLDKITEHQLLPNYPEIPWKNVMGVRDFIVIQNIDFLNPDERESKPLTSRVCFWS